MNSVVHFEVAADDTNRAKKFYTDVFHWKCNDIPSMNYITVETTETDAKTHMVKTPGTINGGITKKDKSAKQTIIVVQVADVKESIKKIKHAGGKLVMPIVEIPGIGHYARVTDTEGNVVGIIEEMHGK